MTERTVRRCVRGREPSVAVLALVCLVAASGSVQGHVPEHPDASDPVAVEDPSVSRVFYLDLGPGDVAVFSFEAAAGQAVELAVNQPTGSGVGPPPELVLVGPGLPNGTPPPEVPAEASDGVLRAEGDRQGPTYEPFGPSADRRVASLNVTAPASGTFHAAVVAEEGAKAAFVIGSREAFSAIEWVTNPIQVLEAYRWAGQSWATIAVPGLLVAAAGALAASRGIGVPRPRTPREGLVAAGGLATLATVATVLVQAARATAATGWTQAHLVTGLVAGLPGLVAGLHARLLAAGVTGSRRDRLRLAGLAALGWVTWSGYVVGPALVALAALAPSSPRLDGEAT